MYAFVRLRTATAVQAVRCHARLVPPHPSRVVTSPGPRYARSLTRGHGMRAAGALCATTATTRSWTTPWWLLSAAGGCGAAWAVMHPMQSTRRAACDAAPGSKVRMALCQIAVTPDKPTNIQTALAAVQRAVQGGAQLVALPECWNSPYAVGSFPAYAEPVPAVGGKVDPSTSPSVAMIVKVRR